MKLTWATTEVQIFASDPQSDYRVMQLHKHFEWNIPYSLHSWKKNLASSPWASSLFRKHSRGTADLQQKDQRGFRSGYTQWRLKKSRYTPYTCVNPALQHWASCTNSVHVLHAIFHTYKNQRDVRKRRSCKFCHLAVPNYRVLTLNKCAKIMWRKVGRCIDQQVRF